jgi:hypothetical protein
MSVVLWYMCLSLHFGPFSSHIHINILPSFRSLLSIFVHLLYL